jgi:pimeloyl-ACP methyl ester carboxylesterase
VHIVDNGTGPALLLIPGIQGRWEYVGAAATALSAAFRVITFPLADEPRASFSFDRTLGFENYVQQVKGALDQCGIDRAVVCGISFGGLIALRFAALYPERTRGLILASTPGPGWHLRRRHEFYARMPYVFGPLFLAESPLRLRREMAAAFPQKRLRWRFAASQLSTLTRVPLSLSRMAYRARLIATLDTRADCARVAAPTLVVTGESALDHVVPVEGSAGYLSLINGAHGAVLERTGHLGSITRPEAFASIVRDFAARRVREVA